MFCANSLYFAMEDFDTCFPKETQAREDEMETNEEVLERPNVGGAKRKYKS